MAKHWNIEQIKWDQFDRSLVDKAIIPLIKTASVVERNSVDYTVYLKNVFTNDPEMAGAFDQWEAEEVQHGEVLGKWAMLADPDWDYKKSFTQFKEFYKINTNVKHSIRGSKSGEFIARCMVEVGTSSYYSALADYVEEPVLKDICRRVAADEFRHYKLFYDYFKKYESKDKLTKWQRAKIAIMRIVESQDDELASAYHVTNEPENMPYNHKRCIALYMVKAIPIYQKRHFSKVINMVFKAIGWMPSTKWQERLASLVMKLIRKQRKIYSKRIAHLS